MPKFDSAWSIEAEFVLVTANPCGVQAKTGRHRNDVDVRLGVLLLHPFQSSGIDAPVERAEVVIQKRGQTPGVPRGRDGIGHFPHFIPVRGEGPEPQLVPRQDRLFVLDGVGIPGEHQLSGRGHFIGAVGRHAGFLDGRKQQPRQHRDDRDHNEQFHNGETTAILEEFASHGGVLSIALRHVLN